MGRIGVRSGGGCATRWGEYIVLHPHHFRNIEIWQNIPNAHSGDCCGMIKRRQVVQMHGCSCRGMLHITEGCITLWSGGGEALDCKRLLCCDTVFTRHG